MINHHNTHGVVLKQKNNFMMALWRLHPNLAAACGLTCDSWMVPIWFCMLCRLEFLVPSKPPRSCSSFTLAGPLPAGEMSMS